MPKIVIPQEWISKLSKEQQIAELNSEVRCKIAPSKIAGVGVFTIRDIKRGERLYCTPNLIPKFYNISFGSLKKLFPEVREQILQRWASVVNGSVFQSPNDDVCLLLFCNHSSDPNYDIVSDTALKDIKKGEEVLEDYGVMENWQVVFPDLKKWQNVSNVEQQKSQTSLDVVTCVKQAIKSWLKNWTPSPNQ